MVLRYNTDGTLDNTFGTGGLAIANVGAASSYVQSIALQDDGKIVAAGMGFNENSNYGFAVARFNSDGSLDNDFDANGTKLFNVGWGNDFATAVAIQNDNQILLGGHTWITNIPLLQYDFAVARLNHDGTIDNSFGESGVTITNLIYGGNYVTDMALQSDGKIILNGNTSSESEENLGIVRYTADGILDTSFGTNGITLTNVAGNSDYSEAVAIQADGKIVTAGTTYDTGNSSQFLIVRYGGDPVGVTKNQLVEINMYPNPATEYIHIKLSEDTKDYQLEIVDITGRLVYSSNIKQSVTIDVSGLAKGSYFINMKSEKISGASHFIKE
jgi:uncharacterized delta-60 repeat protein